MVALALIPLALAVARTPTPGPAEVAFVQADLLRVRAAPDAGAQIVARLRINTAVEVRERRGEWLRLTGPAETEGWAAGSLLGPTRIAPADALARAARGGPDAFSWIERAVAAAPGNAEAWRLLAATADGAGRPERAGHARAVLAGEQPVFFAACEAGRTILDAVYTAAAGFRPERAPPLDGDEAAMTREQLPIARQTAALRRELPRLAEELAAAPWFRIGRGPLEGSPFPVPRYEELARECEVGELRVVLGPCGDQESWVATTAPTSPLRPEEARASAEVRAALAARGLVEVSALQSRIVPGKARLLELRFRGTQAEKGARPRAVQGIAIVGHGPEAIAFVTRPSDGRSSVLSVGVPEWASLDVGPSVRIGVVSWTQDSVFAFDTEGRPADGQSMSERGYWIVVVDGAGRIRTHEVITRVEQPC